MMGDKTPSVTSREIAQLKLPRDRLAQESMLVLPDGRKMLAAMIADLDRLNIPHDRPDLFLQSDLMMKVMQASASVSITHEAASMPVTDNLNLTFARGPDGIMNSARMHLWLFYHLSCIMRAGEREFHLSKPLAESLLLTEIQGIPNEDLRLPFPSFILRIPPGIIDNFHEVTGWHSVRAIFVSEVCAPLNPVGGIPLIEKFINSTASLPEQTEVKRQLAFYALGATNERSVDVHDGCDSYWHVPIPEGEGATVEKAIQWVMERPRNGVVMRTATKNEDAMLLTTRLILNAILYISLPSADVKREGLAEIEKLREQSRKHPKGSHKHTRTLEKLKEAEKKHNIYKVGGSIKVPAEISQAASEEAQGHGRTYTAAWLTRGHFRNQAHGKKWSEHKLIWVAPYINKRDLGTVLSPRPYEVS